MLAETPIIETSPWTPGLITALFGGGALISTAVIGALGKVLVDLRTAKAKAVEAAALAVVAVKKADDVKKNVETARAAGEEAGNKRDQKLDEIHKLVDGKFSIVLDRVARLTRAIANQTGNPADITAAEEAEAAAEAQRENVREAGLKPSDNALDTLRETVADLERQVLEKASKSEPENK